MTFMEWWVRVHGETRDALDMLIQETARGAWNAATAEAERRLAGDIAAERETLARLAETVGDEMDDALAVNCGYTIARLIRAGDKP